jgi:hypothetical protein
MFLMRFNTLAWIATAAAALYAAVGAIELAHDQPTVFADAIDYWMEAIFVAALGLSAAVLASLARAPSSRRAATVGWALGASGSALLAAVALATAIEGREALDGLFPLGFLLIVAGYVTLAVLDARGRLHPSRAGLVLLIGFIGAAAVDSIVGGILGTEGDGGAGGGLVLAATWAAFGRLLSEARAPQTEAPRSASSAARGA